MSDLSESPYTTHPTGWFMVAYSRDLKPGDVKPMKIFGKEVVLYRTASGQAHLIDAYCPHLGAHIGYDGCVVGENIQCPWHGWQYGPDGVNCHIANTDLVRPDAKLRKWHLRESHHVIITWYDALDRAPSWEWPGIPEFADAEGFYQPHEHATSAHAYGVVPTTPYVYIENSADAMHFPFVHGAARPVLIDEWREVSEHYLKVRFKLTFGEGKQTTRMTPDGPVEGFIDNDVYGLGLGTVNIDLGPLRVVQLVSMTPFDDSTSWLWSTIAATRDPASPHEPQGPTRMLMEVQVQQLRRDFTIWSHLRYTSKPKLAGVEGKLYPRLRRWRDRFYPCDDVDSGQVS